MPVTRTPRRPRLRANESPAQSRPSTTAGRSAGKGVLVGLNGRVGHGRPGEVPADALAPRLAETAAESCVAEQPLERGAQRADVARGHEQAGLAVDDQVEQPADRA